MKLGRDELILTTNAIPIIKAQEYTDIKNAKLSGWRCRLFVALLHAITIIMIYGKKSNSKRII